MWAGPLQEKMINTRLEQPQPNRQTLDVYADESCQNAHRYMVLGCTLVETGLVPEVVRTIAEVRENHRLQGEMKWTKVSNSRLDGYKALVDAYFSLVARDVLHFHCLIVDTWQMDNHRFNGGDREIGFSKMIYQLLLHSVQRYSNKHPAYVYLDDRTTSHSLDELKNILNNGIAKRYNIRSRPFRRVVFRESKKSVMLQANDVVLGAVAAHKNEHDLLPGASKAKAELAAHIADRCACSRLGENTPHNQLHFRVWNFKLRTRQKKGVLRA